MAVIPPRHPTRNDFQVAVICALPLEARMVRAVFDRDWKAEGVEFDQEEKDYNAYTLGVIGKHNVVLVHMPGMGSIAAATAAAKLHASFPNIDVAFVVGVCGASPKHISTGQEICLGDCIVSTALIHYGFGRQYPEHFSRKTDIENVPGKAGPAVGSLLAKLQALEDLKGELAQHLKVLQKKSPETCYPGVLKDRLYDSAYLHVHRDGRERCGQCIENSTVCTKSCKELCCEGAQPRASLNSYEEMQKEYLPQVHFGRYGSADTVLKSAMDRDKHIEVDKIIAFEMEAAGIWNSLPTLVVKSACDYADSHKNKEWQPYAAATAAAGLKAILEYWRVVDAPHESGASFLPSFARLIILSDQDTDRAIQTTNANQSHIETCRKADELIRDYYHTSGWLLIRRLSGQELKLDECYINLALIDRSIQLDKKPQQVSFSLEARLRLEASGVDQSISLEDLFNSRKLADGRTVNPRRIFIQGRAGIGKTTLCKKIVFEFYNGRLGSTLFDRLLWIPLRGLRPKQGEYGWQDLLRDTFRMSNHMWAEVQGTYANQFDSSIFNSTSNSTFSSTIVSRTLFLFDGLDEISQRWDDQDPFYHFLNTVIRSLPNVIITSRPQANTFGLDSFDLDLETVGFTTEQTSIYIKNCVKDPDAVAKIEKLIAHKPLIRGLLRIPIQLDAFCYTWNEAASSASVAQYMSDISDTDNSITMTTLYESIAVELCKKDLRLLGKLQPWQRPSSSEVEDELRGELSLLGEIAFQGLWNNVIEFSPQHWDRLRSFFYKSKEEFSTVFRDTLDRLSFLRTSDHDSDYTKRTYHFIHLTFQEFFAARHFAEHWRHDKALTCLEVTSRGRYNSKTPLALLQEEKYNPRYNIFWRFVTGLLSGPHEAVRFFAQLRSEPVDLIGAAHTRLLTFCLSEVVCGQDEELDDLYNREADLLGESLLKEYRLNSDASLGTEIEFPEKVLREIWRGGKAPHTICSIVQRRTILEAQTAEVLAHGCSGNLKGAVTVEVVNALWKHFAVCSQQIQQRTFAVFVAWLNKDDKKLRDFAARTLGKWPPSGAAVNFLIAALKNELWTARKSAAEALGKQSALSVTAINALLASALEDEVQGVRESAISALGGQSSLSNTVINILISSSTFKYGSTNMRSSVARALGRQSSLSEAAINALITMLDDKYPDVRDSAAEALGIQPALPEIAINALIAALKDKDDFVRFSAAEALRKQSPLSEAVIVVLIAAFKDKDLYIRRSAAEALGGESSLSEAIVNLLIATLKDEDGRMRAYAAEALGIQSALSEIAINTLTAALQDESDDVRYSAAEALGEQSLLSETVVDALIATLKDESNSVRYSVISALGRQSLLSETAVDALIAAVKDKSEEVRLWAADALETRPSLSEAAIHALIVLLVDGFEPVRNQAARALDRHSPLSEAAIIRMVTILDQNVSSVWDVLHHQPRFYSMIKSLDVQAWEHIWSFLFRSSGYGDRSCYELAGALYVWSDGTRHKILTDSTQIARFREARIKISKSMLEPSSFPT